MADQISFEVQFRAIFWTFVLPSICYVGCVTNFICIIILLKIRLKEKLFQLFLISSYNNFLYLMMCSFVFIVNCDYICTLDGSYISRLYEMLIYNYLTSVVALFNVCIQILISIEILIIITKYEIKTKFKISFKLTVLVLILISLGLYVPTILSRRIVIGSIKVNDTNSSIANNFILVRTEFGLSHWYKACVIFVSLLRGPLALIIISSINLMNFNKLKKFLNEKYLLQFKNVTTDYKSNSFIIF